MKFMVGDKVRISKEVISTIEQQPYNPFFHLIETLKSIGEIVDCDYENKYIKIMFPDGTPYHIFYRNKIYYEDLELVIDQQVKNQQLLFDFIE